MVLNDICGLQIISSSSQKRGRILTLLVQLTVFPAGIGNLISPSTSCDTAPHSSFFFAPWSANSNSCIKPVN
jgi:hypothetical protein